jgi:hypothetical protein
MNLSTVSRNTICPRSVFGFRYIIENTPHKYNNNNNVFKVSIYLLVIYLPAHAVIRTVCRRILE